MINHVFINKRGNSQCLSNVVVGDETVLVKWWYSTKDQVTEDELNDFLIVKALLELDRDDEAKAIIANGADGTITVDENGVETDTRNQRQKWLDGLFS
jgi:hypothetical protein